MLSLEETFESYFSSNNADSRPNVAKNELFLANLETSQHFFGKIMILELLLKYTTNSNFEQSYGENWFSIVGQDTSAGVKNHIIREFALIIREENAYPNHKKLLDLSSFGFWVGLFDQKIYKELKGLPIASFSNKPKNINRKLLYKSLNEIKAFRNYIYHHKNIFSIGDTSENSFKILEGYDSIIKDLISWINPEALIFFDLNKKIDPLIQVKPLFTV